MNKLILPILLIIGVLLVSGCTQGGDTVPLDTSTNNGDTGQLVDQLTDSGTLDECEFAYPKSQCYFDVAVESNNPSICEKIEYQQSRILCNAVTKKDPLLCNGMETSNEIDKCYSVVAIKTENTNSCGMISQISDKVSCYATIAINTKNPSFCGMISLEEYLASSEAESENNQVKTYMAVLIANTKLNCYSSIAVESNNPSICEKVEDIETKDVCYYNVAKELVNSLICENIQDVDNMNTCKNVVTRLSQEPQNSESWEY